MPAKENQVWESFKEWSVWVPKRWFDMLSVLTTLIPIIVAIVYYFYYTRNTTPPLPLWNPIVLLVGLILFTIVSFLAFNRVRVARDKNLEDKDKVIREKDVLVNQLESLKKQASKGSIYNLGRGSIWAEKGIKADRIINTDDATMGTGGELQTHKGDSTPNPNPPSVSDKGDSQN